MAPVSTRLPPPDAGAAGGPGDGGDGPPPRLSRRAINEAAAWVARLHGPQRSREMELECLAWQRRSAENRHAFERCTEVWMEVPNAALAAGYVPRPRPAAASVREPGADVASAAAAAAAAPRPARAGLAGMARRAPVVAVAASLALVLGASLAAWRWWPEGTAYATAVGEARTVVLQDGSRMILNTDTRVRVDLDARERRVNIEAGEALFEVAKEPGRPFVVRAAASEVVALGTAFAVRLVPAGAAAGESLAVTLLEGQVSLRPAAGGGGGDADAVAPAQALVMQPGERVRLARAPGRPGPARQQLDRPPLEQVTAWRRNEAVFDRTSLADAVAEMNRYSRTPLVLVGELARSERLVSGQYPTGDNAGFAKALAALHGLVVREREGRLELSKGS